MNRKMLVLPPAIALVAATLGGCGSPVGGGEDDGPIVVGTTDRFVASKEVPAPFDPAYAYESGSWTVLRQTLQTLTVLPRGGGEPVPEAARQCDFTGSGSERYVCTLRSGLKFSDGTPITASDVKYSIDRVRRINSESGVSGLLSTIDTVEVQGTRTVVFHLRAPDATFPYKLATPAAGIVKPAHYAANRLRNGFDISGSGPYTMKAVVLHGTMVKAVFSRNPHYLGELRPKSDTVELHSYAANPDAMGKDLDDGDIDLMTHTMSPAQIAKYSENVGDSGSIKLVESPGLQIGFLGFDTDDPAVRNKAVRQAMAQLVDRQELTSRVYGTTAQPLYSVVPASIAGHTNAFFNKYGAPSTAKAAEILRKAHISTPVRLTLHYTSDHYGPSEKKTFEVLRQQLNAGGLFATDIQGTKWNEYRAAELKGSYGVYGLGWFPDFPDADNFVAPFFDKGNALGSPYDNSEIRDDLIPASREETDRSDVAKALTPIQNIVAEDVPILPLWQGKQYVAVHDDVQGAQWALDASSTLRLWELSRGVSA